MAVTVENSVFWDVMPCGSYNNWPFKECIASIIGVTRIGILDFGMFQISMAHSIACYYSVVVSFEQN
jgi:hypothetical protein